MSIVKVEGLTKTFESHGVEMTAVDDLSLTLERGEFVCLLGPSGCGKTTTLRSIAGLETPTSGRIEINGQVVYSSETQTYTPPEQRGLGMVFQSYAVWPHMTVAQNVAFPMKHGTGKADKRSKEEINERVMRILETMDCAHLASRYPSELSGGQQQRVALARTLVYEPDLLLFDEPLSNLDAKLRERMRLELRELQQRLGFAALYVTHDREEALSLSDRMLVMRDGKVAQAGAPEEIYERPVDVFVADFVGPVNILPASGVRIDGDEAVAQTDLGEVQCVAPTNLGGSDVDPEQEMSVLIRPGSLSVESRTSESTLPSASNSWVAQLDSTTYLGEQLIYVLSIGTVRLTATGPTGRRIHGTEVRVTASREACKVIAGSLPGVAKSRANAPLAAANA